MQTYNFWEKIGLGIDFLIIATVVYGVANSGGEVKAGHNSTGEVMFALFFMWLFGWACINWYKFLKGIK